MSHTGIGRVIAGYDVILCDIWGVLHDGLSPHGAAADALHRFRRSGGAVVLVSNAPRPATDVIDQLDRVGVPRAAWDGIVTSGDVTRHLIEQSGCRKVNHIGPDRDLGLYDPTRIDIVAGDEAEIVVCTGLFDDHTEKPDDYRVTLQRLVARGLPMICANPDRVVERGDELVWCAGALADVYTELGGTVTEVGKPHPLIYQFAMSTAAAVRHAPVSRDRVLAVGDAVRTDMMGAMAAGIATVFVAHGIHTQDVGDPIEDHLVDALLSEVVPAPLAVMPRLVW